MQRLIFILVLVFFFESLVFPLFSLRSVGQCLSKILTQTNAALKTAKATASAPLYIPLFTLHTFLRTSCPPWSARSLSFSNRNASMRSCSTRRVIDRMVCLYCCSCCAHLCCCSA